MVNEAFSFPGGPYLLAIIAIAFAVGAIITNVFVAFRRNTKDKFDSETDYQFSERSIESIRPSRYEPNSISFVKLVSLTISIIAAIIAALSLYLSFPRVAQKFSGGVSFINAAYAQSPSSSTSIANAGIAGMIPYILAGVFIIMILAFSVSVITLLTIPANEQNERRLSAADNIVKTFGGFFIGFATSLLNLGH